MYMDRLLIPTKIRRPNRLGHLFTRRRWNKLRDAVKNKIYKKNKNSLNNIIHQANVNEIDNEIDNATYIPTENIRYTIEDEPLTNAIIFNPSENIDNYDNYEYHENINLGEPLKIGTVESDIKKPFLSRLKSTIKGEEESPEIEEIVEILPQKRLTKKSAGSKLNQKISSKRKNKHIRKTYKKKMYKI